MGKLQNLILQFVSCSYLFAFCSLYVQIPGLYGDYGILPAKAVLRNGKYYSCISRIFNDLLAPNSWVDFMEQPSLLRFGSEYGLAVADAMDLTCLMGIIVSILIILYKSFRTTFFFSVLWILYGSVYEVIMISAS